MPDGKDLYAVLGLAKGASADEIKQSYRKLVRKWHPDVNPGNAAAEDRFKDISAAYDVLSDPEKRKLYDEFGEEGLRGGFDPEQARAYKHWQERRASSSGPGRGPESFDFDLEDLQDLFGEGFRRAGGRRPGRGQDVHVRAELSFTDALRGTEIEVQLPNTQTCTVCHGSGDDPGAPVTTCPDCGGSGRAQMIQGPMQLMTACPGCGGTGKRGAACRACGGTGEQTRSGSIKVRIPPGAEDGSHLTVKGRGLPGRHGGPAGDLLIETAVRPHPHFKRLGADLELQLPVSLDELYNGAKVEVPTPDGPVQMRIPARSQPGARLRLRGKGATRKGQRGDLFVVLHLRLPDKYSEALAQAAKAAAGDYDKPLREGITL